MPAAKKDQLLIDANSINRILVSVTFEIDVQENLDGAMQKVSSILDKIASQAEISDDAVEMKLEASI